MKTVPYDLAGQTYYLCLNGTALFDCYDHFGPQGNLLDHIMDSTGDSHRATCWMLSKLAEQGELVRRFDGMDHGKFLSAQKAMALMSPEDALRAKEAIKKAYVLAFAREEATDEEIDLYLLELQKKTDAASPGHGISKWLRSFFTFL